MFSPKKIHFFASIIFIFCFFGLNRGISFGGSAGVCAMGCAVAPVPTPNNMVSPQTYTQTIMQTMTKIAAVQQNLMLAEEFYQYMKSFAYMKASPGLFGAVSYIGNMTSAMSGMAQQGLAAYQQSANAFGAGSYALTPAEYNNMAGTLGLAATTAGSLSSMSSTLSMLNMQNGGSPGLALINGSAMVTQAALTGTQATMNILSYYNNRDFQKQLQNQGAITYEQQKATAMRPAHIPIPCRNIPAYLPLSGPFGTVGGGGGSAALNTPESTCNTVGVGTNVDFSTSSGMGVNQAMQQYNQKQVNTAISQGAPVTLPTPPPVNLPAVPGGGAPPPQVGVTQ